eukprot:5976468-Prymnesium_polylepis.1
MDLGHHLHLTRCERRVGRPDGLARNGWGWLGMAGDGWGWLGTFGMAGDGRFDRQVPRRQVSIILGTCLIVICLPPSQDSLLSGARPGPVYFCQVCLYGMIVSSWRRRRRESAAAGRRLQYTEHAHCTEHARLFRPPADAVALLAQLSSPE